VAAARNLEDVLAFVDPHRTPATVPWPRAGEVRGEGGESSLNRSSDPGREYGC
jgi:hypothetical protein